MGPGGVSVNETLQKQGRCDRPAEAAIRRIGQVGDLTIDRLVLARPKRHPPEWVVRRLRRRQDVIGQVVIIAKQGR